VREWGIDTPLEAPTVSGAALASRTIANFTLASAEFTANEGALSYVTGQDGVANAAVNLGNVQTLISQIPVVEFSTEFDEAVVGTIRDISLAATGVAAGQYTKVTVDLKGRVTAGTSLVIADLPQVDPGTGAVGLVAYLLDIGSKYIDKNNAVAFGSLTVEEVGEPTTWVAVSPASAGVPTDAGINWFAASALVQGIRLDATAALEARNTYALATANQLVLKSHLDAALAAVANNGSEDTWTADGATDWFVFTNIPGARANASPGRLFLFVDGVFQQQGNYLIQTTGIQFATMPQLGAVLDARFID
jgi:phage-related tail fiber protein